MQTASSAQPPSSETAPATPAKHRHLALVPPQASARKLFGRWSVVVLSLAAVGLQVASLFQPWWWIKLYAPQYPKGLKIIISLTSVTGDVKEVDLLNHYIGMESLQKAAQSERAIAGYAIAILALCVIAVALLAGKKLGRLAAVLGFAFPFAFLADSVYWMYRFGHSLNPDAPIELPPFTPQLFGNGKIGQFMTFAQPTTGFWLAVAAFVALLLATVIRARVCASCANVGTCGAVCRDAFIGPKAGVRR